MNLKEFSIPVRVYIEDTDAGKIVYYVNYLKYMERARTEYFRELGYEKPAFISDDRLIVVASVEVSYKKSARLDDSLRVTASVHQAARSYAVFQQRIWRLDECLCEGLVKVACVEHETMKPKPFPQQIYKVFRESLGEPQ